MGDFAYPCFRLAKVLRQAPNQIAAQLAEKMQGVDFLQKVEAAGPYLNLFVDKSLFSRSVLTKVLEQPGRLWQKRIRQG